MAKLKYRSGSSFITLVDTSDISAMKSHISALQSKTESLPRLPTYGSTAGDWPFGVVYWNVSSDKKLFSLHGNIFFDSCTDAWNAMKQILGQPSGTYGLLVPTPLGSQTGTKWVPATGFVTTNSTITAGGINRLSLTIGTDGYCYVHPTTSKPVGDGNFLCFIECWYVNVDDY